MTAGAGPTPDFDELFARTPVMAILRGHDPARTVALCEAAWSVGIDVVEVPIQSPAAVASLTAAVQAAQGTGRVVGAGTVTSPERVARAVDAGARFTVAPGLDTAVTAASRAAGLPHLAGVATATDVQAALADGQTWLKAFPASVLGTGWFAAMRGPFPGLPLVATGGIDAHNARDYLAAGARVVAVGSALDDPRQLDLLAELTAG